MEGRNELKRLEAISYNGNHLTRIDNKVYMLHYMYLLQLNGSLIELV